MNSASVCCPVNGTVPEAPAALSSASGLLQCTPQSLQCSSAVPSLCMAAAQAKHPKSPKLLNRRNWCLVSDAAAKLSQPAWASEEGALIFTLRVEDPEDQRAVPDQFHTIVPPLVLHPKGMRPTAHSKGWAKRLGCASAPDVMDPLAEF